MCLVTHLVTRMVTRKLNRFPRTFATAGRLSAAACLLPGLLLAAPAARAQEHIAAVNSDRILRESVPAQAADKRIKDEFDKRRKELEDGTKKLRLLAEKMDRDGASMGDAERSRQQLLLSQMDLELQRKRRALDEDVNQRRNEELQSVLDRANRAIRQIAEQNKYDLIVQEAVYVNPRIDITDKVLKLLATPGN